MEQALETDAQVEATRKLLICNNTAEIIARFSEKGWADVYLSEVSTSIYQVVETESHTMIEEHEPLVNKSFTAKKGNWFVRRRAKKRAKEFQNATFIDPTKIRLVFAEIDRQFD